MGIIKKFLKKRWKRIGLAILSFLLVTLLAGILAVNSPLFKRFLIKKVDVSLEKKFGLDLKIDSLDISLSRFSALLRGIELSSLQPENAPLKLLRVRQLFLNLSLRALLFGKIHIQELTIIEPHLVLGQAEKKRKIPSLSFIIEAFDLERGRIDYANRNYLFESSFKNIRVQAFYSKKEGRHRGDIKTQEGRVVFSGSQISFREFLLQFAFDTERLDIEKCFLATGLSSLQGTGWVQNLLDNPSFHFDLKSTLSLEEVSPFLPPPQEAKGQMALSAKIQGQGKQYAFSGNLGGKDLIFNRFKADELEISFSGNEKSITLSQIGTRLAGGNLRARLELDHSPIGKFSLSLNWNSLNLKTLTAILPDFPLLFSSTSSGKIEARGPSFGLENLMASGEVTFIPLESFSPQPSGENSLRGRLNFQIFEGTLTVDRANFTINKDTIAFSGTLSNDESINAQFSLSFEDLRATKILFLQVYKLRGIPLPKSLESLEAGGQVSLSGKARGKLEKLIGSLSLKAKNIMLKNFSAEEITGSANFSGNLLSPNLDFKTKSSQIVLGGEDISFLEAEGSLRNSLLSLEKFFIGKEDGMISGRLSFHPKKKTFSATIQGNEIKLETFKSVRYQDKSLEGSLEFNLEAEGSPQAPKLKFELRAESLGASEMKLGDLRMNAVSDGKLIESSLVLPQWNVLLESKLKLEKPFVIEGRFEVADLSLDHLLAMVRRQSKQPFICQLTLSSTFNLPLENWKDLYSRLEIKKVKLSWEELAVENAAPILASVEKGAIQIESFKIKGSGTEFSASGKIPFLQGTMDKAKVEGKINLQFLEPFLQDMEVHGILSVKGEISGNLFEPRLTAEVRLEEGAFFSPLLPYRFYHATLHLLIEENMAKLENLSLSLDRGQIQAQGSFSLAQLFPKKSSSSLPAKKTEIADISMRFTQLDLGNFFQPIQRQSGYPIGGSADGKIHLTAKALDLNQITAEGNIEHLLLSFSHLQFENEKEILFNFKEKSLELKEAKFLGDKSEIKISGTASLGKIPEIDARISSRLDLSSLALLFKDAAIGGEASVDLGLKGEVPNPLLKGALEVKNGFIELPDFPLKVNDVNGALVLRDSRVIIQDLKGIANGGSFKVEGRVDYRQLTQVDFASVKLSLENFLLNYPEGLVSRSEASLVLEGKNKKWLLSGDLKLVETFYSSDIYPGTRLLNIAVSRPYRGRGQFPSFLQDVNLDIGIATIDSIIINNNLANLAFAGNMKVSGNLMSPILSGRVENRGMGEIVFGERRYVVEKARADFLGTEIIDPQLEVMAHTSLVHRSDQLEVKLTLSGTLSNPNYTLSSFPSLSQEDLALLLLTGRSLDEIRGSEVNTLRNQMILHFAFPIASPVTAILKNLLKAEAVSIEPLNIASEEDPGARFTFKKRISPQAAVTYSADVTNSQKQTWVLDYNLNRNFSIRSFRKDDGSYGSSFKHSFALGASGYPDQKSGQAQRSELRLKSLQINGDLRFPQELIKKKIKLLKVGAPLSFFNLNKARDKLIEFYKKNCYLNAAVTPEIEYEDSNTIHLRLTLSPQNQAQIVFKGDSLPGKIKRKLLDSWSGEVPEEIAIEEAKNLILNDLHRRHYPSAKVSAEKRQEGERINYIFTTLKGRRFGIRNFLIRGNTALSSSVIKNAISKLRSPKGKGFWLLLYDKKRAFREVKRLYEENGFLEARILPPEIIEDQQIQAIDLILPIQEGLQSRVKEVVFSGNKSFEIRELSKGLRLSEGKIFNPSLLLEDRNELLNLYKSKGFQDAEIVAEIRQEREGQEIKINYQIEEGIVHKAEEIVITGHERTSESFIRKELKIKEGDLLNLSRLSLSQKSLYDTGVFRSVNISSQPLEGEKGKERVVVEVLEEPRFSMTYGLRYNSEEKWEGFGETNFSNLFGWGRNGLLYYRQNSRQKNLRFSLKDPYLFGKKLNSLYSFFYSHELKASFITDEIGFTFQQQLTLPYDLLFSYLYRLNRIHTYEVQPSGPYAFDISLFLSELSFFLVRDTREDRLDAKQGSFFSINFSYSPQFLGSELTYIRFFSQYSFYKAIIPTAFPNLVWASNYRLGLASAFDQVLIPSKRYYAGGGNSIRGFKQDMVGPYDSFLERPEGGNAVFIMNQEIRFPIYRWLKGVAFYDMGNVYSALRKVSLSDTRQSVGLGLRLTSPLGLFRLDYGLNLYRRPGEPRGVFFLSLGQSF